MKRKMTISGIIAALFLALLIPAQGWASDLRTYDEASDVEIGGSGNDRYFDIVPVGGFSNETPAHTSWFTAVDFFPDSADGSIGSYDVAGRMICATGNKIYLQEDYGSADDTDSTWVVVAEFDSSSYNMDPSFIHVSPDGTKVAIGPGWQKGLYIVPVSVLNNSNPPDLLTVTTITKFPNVEYYDGEWVDNQFMVINRGDDYQGSGSKVLSVDTNNSSPSTYEGDDLITAIGGASGDVHVVDYLYYPTAISAVYAIDSDVRAVDSLERAAAKKDVGYRYPYRIRRKAVVTGNGYSTNDTGELKLFPARSNWFKNGSTPTSVAYSTGKLLADAVLSAAYLDTDDEGNLSVGGGSWLSSNGSEMGFAALISKSVVSRVANGSGNNNKVDESKDNPANANCEYREFSPDPCDNDSATGILFSGNGRELIVNWNANSMPTNASPWSWTNIEADPASTSGCTAGVGSEYWMDGSTSRLSIYLPDDPTDDNDDDIADIFDDAPYN